MTAFWLLYLIGTLKSFCFEKKVSGRKAHDLYGVLVDQTFGKS